MSPNGRILTTHVGSLPRPDDVVEQVFKVDNGEAVDPAEYDRIIGGAVADRVRHQADAGVDLVSDGEMSKIGYATYIRHRLSGFELGDVPRATPADLDAYPSFRDRLAKAGATAKYKRPICRGPISYENREPLERDLAHLRAAVDASDVTGGFMNAPSPGVIALFQPNEFYGTLDEYLDALADAMKVEYEGIVNAGFQLQIDAPDLAMGRHIMYRDQPDEVFVEATERHVAAINRALADVPGDQVRLHVCWGNYEGPHHLDIPVERIMDHILEAEARDDPLRGGQPAARPRVDRVARRCDPRRQDPGAGRDLVDVELHRAPRAHRTAPPDVRRDRGPRSRRRRDRLRLRHVVGVRPDRPDDLLGEARVALRGRGPRVEPAVLGATD